MGGFFYAPWVRVSGRYGFPEGERVAISLLKGPPGLDGKGLYENLEVPSLDSCPLLCLR